MKYLLHFQPCCYDSSDHVVTAKSNVIWTNLPISSTIISQKMCPYLQHVFLVCPQIIRLSCARFTLGPPSLLCAGLFKCLVPPTSAAPQMRHEPRFTVTRWCHWELLLSSDSCAPAICTRPHRGSRFCRLLTALEKDQRRAENEAVGGSEHS